MEEKKTIRIRLQSHADLFSRFDPTGTRLSGDLYSYIKTCFEEIPLLERTRAVICLEGDVETDGDRFLTLLRTAVDRELQRMDTDIRINRLKMWRLYIIGIVLVIVGVVLALSLNQIILQLISIVGSMAVKDAATIQIQHNPDLRVKKRLLEQLKTVPCEVQKLNA
ncbi:MAG: hypothetical protein IJ083_02175 [Clostridia bacterium]|nr:hypothetical protein [Clostridia bacterium]